MYPEGRGQSKLLKSLIFAWSASFQNPATTCLTWNKILNSSLDVQKPVCFDSWLPFWSHQFLLGLLSPFHSALDTQLSTDLSDVSSCPVVPTSRLFHLLFPLPRMLFLQLLVCFSHVTYKLQSFMKGLGVEVGGNTRSLFAFPVLRVWSLLFLWSLFVCFHPFLSLKLWRVFVFVLSSFSYSKHPCVFPVASVGFL